MSQLDRRAFVVATGGMLGLAGSALLAPAADATGAPGRQPGFSGSFPVEPWVRTVRPTPC
ncbi:MAG TPA: hypothetical protein VJ914_05475 [Pseudonocardiaceae bacterium]|nr:hypothetical protein [Pseudonocardiaceae bacterium]